jgi:hypothetical protein
MRREPILEVDRQKRGRTDGPLKPGAAVRREPILEAVMRAYWQVTAPDGSGVAAVLERRVHEALCAVHEERDAEARVAARTP